MGKHAWSFPPIGLVFWATLLTSASFTNGKEVIHGRVSSNILNSPSGSNKGNSSGATGSSSQPASLPSSLEVNVTLGGEDLHLKLVKNVGLTSSNLPVYILSTDSNGTEQSHRAQLPDTEYAVYRDPQHEAAFGLYREKDSNGTERVKMEGFVRTAGKTYDLKSTGHTRRTVVRRRREVADQHRDGSNNDSNATANNTNSVHVTAADEKSMRDEDKVEEFEVDVIIDPLIDVGDLLPESATTPRKKEMVLTPMPMATNASQPSMVNRTLSPLQPLPDLHDIPGPLHRRKKRRGRRRRQATNIYVDVVALVDYGVYKAWYSRSTGTTADAKQEDTLIKLRRYYAFIMNGVSMIYDSINSQKYKINVRLSSVVISAAASSSNWTERFRRTASVWDEVDASSALKAASDWAGTTDILPPYDHLMIFTGYDLTKTLNGAISDKITGLAYTGTVCMTNGKASSIVEDLGGFQCIGTAAHELGHGLLAEHDGTENTCRSEDRYVMAAGTYTVTTQNKYNPWIFSSCSITYFTNFITERLRTSRGSQCLYTALTTSSSVTNVASLKEGQLYDPDEQCRQVYGPSSRLCRGPEFGTAADVCTDMFCYDPTTTGTCYQLVAARGTTCGNKKWCESGRCVENSSAPTVSENCVFGDQPGLAFQDETCQVFVDATPGYCYQDVVRVRCCASCQRHYRYVQNCEYGDRSTGCSSSSCPFSSTSYKESCCGSCNYGDPITTTTTSTSTTTTTTSTTTTTTTTPVPRVTITTANPDSVKSSPAGTTNPSTSTAPTTITTTITTTTTSTTTTPPPTPIPTSTTTTAIPTTSTTTATTTPIIITTTTTTPTTSTTTNPTTTTTATTTTSGKGTNTPTPTPTIILTSTPAPTSTSTIIITTPTANTSTSTTTTTYSEGTSASPKTSPSTDALCVDNSTVTINQKDCKTLVGANPESCYHPQVITHCCKSCQEVSTGIKDCEYGDRNPFQCDVTNTTDVCARLPQVCCKSCFTGGQDASAPVTFSVLAFSVGVALLMMLSIF